MSLCLVSTPIGNIEDITLFALRQLREADVIIAEERKPLFQLFRDLELPRPENFHLLNEHSDLEELQELLELCKTRQVALISDCGTPGFCDPGADLVRLCRSNKVKITVAPGASSLMCLLTLSGLQLKEFHFQGFLPAKNELRQKALKSLQSLREPVVLMDTPYRLHKLLEELKKWTPDHQIALGLKLTHPDQEFITGTVRQLRLESLPKKCEFILLIWHKQKHSKTRRN